MLSGGLAFNGAIFGVLFRPLRLNAAPDTHAKCNVALLKNPTFWLFFANQALWNMGSMIFIVLVADYAKESGISRDDAAWLLAATGISGTLGRILTAAVSKCANRLVLYNAATVLSGVAIGLVPLTWKTFAIFLTSCIGYGVCLGLQASLLGILTADFFSIEQLNSAFGYLIASNGLGALLGPPIAGRLTLDCLCDPDVSTTSYV